MAARILEHDFGTKSSTKRKIRQLQRESPQVMDRMMFRWWQKVYLQALREVPVDTGALRNSIRIEKGQDNTGRYDVARGDGISEYYIIAGGGGVINPKHKREVDYGKVVHDGSSRQPPNPFLDRAILKCEDEFEKFVKEYLDWYQKEWKEDQPTAPSSWSLPIRMRV